jgi:hypothetical protein
MNELKFNGPDPGMEMGADESVEKTKTAQSVEYNLLHAEVMWSYIKTRMEFFLRQYGTKINAGNNGVIFRLDLFEICAADPGLRDMLKEKGIDTEALHQAGAAVKILKTYQPGLAARESKVQTRAHELVSAAQAREENVAAVPEVYMNLEFEVSDEGKEELEKLGCTMSDKNDLGLIVMDHIPGEDVATILYREALYGQKIIDDEGKEMVKLPTDLSAEDITRMPFEELQQLVATVYRFEEWAGAPMGGAVALEEMEQKKANAEKLFRAVESSLQKRGLTFHPNIAQRLRATSRIFRQNGLNYRDGHPRNIMLAGDYLIPTGAIDRVSPDVYVIDYGDSYLDEDDKSLMTDRLSHDLLGSISLLDRFTKNSGGGRKIYKTLEENRAVGRSAAQYEGQSLEQMLTTFVTTAQSKPDLNRVEAFELAILKKLDSGEETVESISSFLQDCLTKKTKAPYGKKEVSLLSTEALSKLSELARQLKDW